MAKDRRAREKAMGETSGLLEMLEAKTNVAHDADALKKAGFNVTRVFTDEIEVSSKDGKSTATVMPLWKGGVQLRVEAHYKEKDSEAAAKRLRSLGF